MVECSGGIAPRIHAPHPRTQWTGGCVGCTAGVGVVVRGKNHFSCRNSNPGRPDGETGVTFS